jgi:hypothetical protein
MARSLAMRKRPGQMAEFAGCANVVLGAVISDVGCFASGAGIAL